MIQKSLERKTHITDRRYNFRSSLTEGAANGWLSLSLIESFNKSEAYGAFALGIFVASMTMTRMFASPFVERYGRIQCCVCTALGGLGILIFVFRLGFTYV